MKPDSESESETDEAASHHRVVSLIPEKSWLLQVLSAYFDFFIPVTPAGRAP
jgi:hypothetical protein